MAASFHEQYCHCQSFLRLLQHGLRNIISILSEAVSPSCTLTSNISKIDTLDYVSAEFPLKQDGDEVFEDICADPRNGLYWPAPEAGKSLMCPCELSKCLWEAVPVGDSPPGKDEDCPSNSSS